MALKTKAKFTRAEVAAGMMLADPMAFARVVMGDKLRIQPDYPGIPDAYKSRFVFSHEQRMMLQDGVNYAFWRWRNPKLALGSHKILLRTSRKTAKTTFSFELRYSWYAVIHPMGKQSEAMLHAPGDKQISPVESRIERTILESPLLRLMFGHSNKEHGIWTWKTGLVYHHRIEGQRVQDAGHGMVGIAAVYILGDEGAYSRTGPYNERVTVALPDCQEVWCGVPREGETGMFKRVSDTQWAVMESGGEPEWSLHRNPPIDSQLWKRFRRRYHMGVNPLYHSNKAWRSMMGTEGWDSTTVLTQVLGLEAEGGRSAFPNVVTAPIPFYYRYVTPTDVHAGLIEGMIDSFGIHEMGIPTWGIFCDYGFSPSPMETVIAYKDDNIWYEFARISAHRLDPYEGAKLIAAIDRAIPNLATYVVVDVHGQGKGLRSDLIKMPDYADLDYDTRLRTASFETYMDDDRLMLHKKCKTPAQEDENDMWFCPACDAYVSGKEIEPARVQAKELLTSDLVLAFNHASRRLMGDSGRPDGGFGLVLAASDTDAIEEFRETAAVQVGKNTKFVGPADNDHITDAFRCIAAGERGGVAEPSLMSSGPQMALAQVRLFEEPEPSWGYGAVEAWNL